MRTIRLGRTEAEIPAVSLGTWAHGGPRRVKSHAVGWTGHDDEAARQALRVAYDEGIRHWDTADVYGDGRAERLMGEVLRDLPREELFLATKVGWDPGPWGHYYHPEQIRRRLGRSLDLLGVERVDLYYLHHCDFGPSGERLDLALETLERLREQGKFRFLGLSDWKAEEILRHAPRVNPDVIQVYRTVVHDAFRRTGLAAWAEQHDVGRVFFSPLRHGLLLGKYEEPADFPPGDHRSRIDAFGDPARLASLRECRRRIEDRFPDHPHPVLWALTATLVQDTSDACVLVGLRNARQARAAGTLGDPISPEDAAWVRDLYRSLPKTS